MNTLKVCTLVVVSIMLVACGDSENKTNSTADSANAQASAASFDDLVTTHGEDKIKSMYVDIQAHAEAGFLTNLIDIPTSKLMEMSPEERKEYAVEQGKKKGKEVARRIGEACEANGITMAEWRLISSYAQEHDWRDEMIDRIQMKKDELKATRAEEQPEEETMQ